MTSASKPATALATLMLAALSVPALAQDPAGLPQATTATYRDWTLRCSHLPGEPPQKICEVAQAVRVNDGQAVLAQVVLGRLAPDQPLKLIVQLPAGMWLPANVTLTAPTGESVTAVYTRCQQICVADTDTDDAFINALRAAPEPAILAFQDGNRRPVELHISLDGFTAATNQMTENTR